jgi:hypothetical protein
MSDIRFIIIGIVLVFSGIIVMSVFGSQFSELTIQAEFDKCYEYYEDEPPTEIDCDAGFQDKIFAFTPAVILIALGVFSIIKGIRGVWDQDVKPEDMVGPNNSFDTRDEPKDSDDD